MSLRLVLSTIALAGFLGLSLGLYAAEEQAEGMGMEHLELAEALVRALGLQSELPVTATPADYATYLQKQGIGPLRGWIPGAEVTREDLAVATVEALGLAAEVEDPQSPDSYMAVLSEEERNIELTTVMEVLKNVTVAAAITDLVLYSPITILYETFLSPVEAK